MDSTSNSFAHEKMLHERAVRDIAESRFALDGWQVQVNPSSTGHSFNGGAVPDIVAIHSDAVVAIGAVETGEISQEKAHQWKCLGESCVRFYLYVPHGTEKTATKLIADHEIPCAGLRTFRYNGKLEIESVHLEEFRCAEDDHPWWMSVGGN